MYRSELKLPARNGLRISIDLKLVADTVDQILLLWSMLTWITVIFFHPGPLEKKVNQNT